MQPPPLIIPRTYRWPEGTLGAGVTVLPNGDRRVDWWGHRDGTHEVRHMEALRIMSQPDDRQDGA